MRIIVLGGFLGSGKTTVLMQLARYITLLNGSPRVVILENEIGEVGVDDKLLAGSSFSVENVFSGCICCSGAADLVNGVKKIAEDYAPDWLLIESTGMALPSSVKETLRNSLGLSSAVVCIVDSSRWMRIRRVSPDFSVAQLKGTDMVILTKTDKADEDRLADALKDIRVNVETLDIRKVNALKPIDETIFRDMTAMAEMNTEPRK